MTGAATAGSGCRATVLAIHSLGSELDPGIGRLGHRRLGFVGFGVEGIRRRHFHRDQIEHRLVMGIGRLSG